MPRPTKHTRHPVEALLREAVSNGQRPDAADIDALELPRGHRALFDDAVDDALKLWEGGDRGAANERALVAGRNIVSELPARLRDPGYNHRDPLAEVTDPAALAEAVPRGIMGLPGPFASATENRA